MLEQALEENRKEEEEARKREEGLREIVCKLLQEVKCNSLVIDVQFRSFI
ncbi:hypothetical protein CDL12_06012 [Handroanthus impetiginosus]|uniref:Uncharacterized protein n=1 Tax=Handroanthus impetiginosus TaxID=429701 RepID=A0A2G9HUT3_9LAMI|nr:hypothetical protein CDL12_06012 [Handroanthus impetiginosus]